jgi:hypothetical protein
MKFIRVVGAIFLLLILPFRVAAQKERAASNRSAAGSICVAAIPRPNPGGISLGNPAGGNRNFNFSIQVDDRPIMDASFDTGRLISGLSIGKSHLVKIRRDREVVQSFRFSFKKYSSKDLCLWFKTLYETWQLWEAKGEGAKCRCES